MHNTSSSKSYAYVSELLPYLVLALLSIPLFLFNIHNTHSWGGDDYAQYIIEAQNIAQGKAYHTSGYVFNNTNICYSPPQYPPGFPLLLAPVVARWGLSIMHMCYFNSLLATVLMLVIFAWFRKYASALISVCIALLITYSWYIIDLKQSILSDLPCLLFTMLYLLWHNASTFRPWRILLLICAASMAMLIRTQSVLLLAAECLLLIYTLSINLVRKQKTLRTEWLPPLLIITGSLTLHTLLTKVVFPAPASASGFYVQYLRDVWNTGLITIFRNNVNFFMQTLNGFFYYPTDSGFRTALNTIMQNAGSILTIAGFAISVSRRLHFHDVFFFLMVLLMLYYPIHDSRYFFPAMAVVYYYCFIALQRILPALTSFPPKKIALAIAIVSLVTGWKYLRSTLDEPIGYIPVAKDYKAFNYLSTHVRDNELIVCSRPRLLTLYTGRRCTIHSWLLPMENNKRFFDSMQVKYILSIKGLSDEFYTSYFTTQQKPIDSVIIADGYTLYTMR